MTETDSDGRVDAVLLDYLARGRSDDDRPQYERSPVAYAVGREDFGLYELRLSDDTDLSIGDAATLFPADERTPGVEDVNRVEESALSGGAQSELDYAVAEIVEAEEERFVDYYNDAQPITLRLHQLDLLPGIGEKLRNDILDARKRKPFESFEDLESRISGLHDPKATVVERILTEIREDDVKYRAFAAPPE